jgi:hypothetical protein
VLASVVVGVLLAWLSPSGDRAAMPLMRNCQWMTVDVRHGDGYTIIEQVLVCNPEVVRGGKE